MFSVGASADGAAFSQRVGASLLVRLGFQFRHVSLLLSHSLARAAGIAVFAQPKDSPPWLKASTMIFTTAAGYPIVYPGGAFRKSLTEFWLKETVPKDYDHLIVEVKSHEAPGQWWNRLNSSQSYQNVNFPTVSWAGQ